MSRESKLTLDLDHKRLKIRIVTIKNIAVQIRVHLSSKIFDIYFNPVKFTDIIIFFKFLLSNFVSLSKILSIQ